METIKKFINHEFNFDFYNGNGVNSKGMVIKRCKIIRIDWDDFRDGELQFTYEEKRGFNENELEVSSTWDFIKKKGNGYKIYFDDDVVFINEKGEIEKTMDAFFE